MNFILIALLFLKPLYLQTFQCFFDLELQISRNFLHRFTLPNWWCLVQTRSEYNSAKKIPRFNSRQQRHITQVQFSHLGYLPIIFRADNLRVFNRRAESWNVSFTRTNLPFTLSFTINFLVILADVIAEQQKRCLILAVINNNWTTRTGEAQLFFSQLKKYCARCVSSSALHRTNRTWTWHKRSKPVFRLSSRERSRLCYLSLPSITSMHQLYVLVDTCGSHRRARVIFQLYFHPYRRRKLFHIDDETNIFITHFPFFSNFLRYRRSYLWPMILHIVLVAQILRNPLGWVK